MHMSDTCLLTARECGPQPRCQCGCCHICFAGRDRCWLHKLLHKNGHDWCTTWMILSQSCDGVDVYREIMRPSESLDTALLALSELRSNSLIVHELKDRCRNIEYCSNSGSSNKRWRWSDDLLSTRDGWSRLHDAMTPQQFCSTPLEGLTGMRTDPAWASRSDSTVQGKEDL